MLSKFYYKPMNIRPAPSMANFPQESIIDIMKMYAPKNVLILILKEYNHVEPFKEDII